MPSIRPLASAFGLVWVTIWLLVGASAVRGSRPLTIHEISLMTAYLDKPAGSWFWPERRFSVDGSATTSRVFRSAAAFEAIGMLRGGIAMLTVGIQAVVVLVFIVVPIVIAATRLGKVRLVSAGPSSVERWPFEGGLDHAVDGRTAVMRPAGRAGGRWPYRSVGANTGSVAPA